VCDVFQARSGDDLGDCCSHRATAQCSDCGVHVCESHAENDEACGETFRPSCMSFIVPIMQNRLNLNGWTGYASGLEPPPSRSGVTARRYTRP